jgi:hypothetical protein
MTVRNYITSSSLPEWMSFQLYFQTNLILRITFLIPLHLVRFLSNSNLDHAYWRVQDGKRPGWGAEKLTEKSGLGSVFHLSWTVMKEVDGANATHV